MLSTQLLPMTHSHCFLTCTGVASMKSNSHLMGRDENEEIRGKVDGNKESIGLLEEL